MKRNKLPLKLLIITLLISFSNYLVAAISVTISLSNPSDCNSNDGTITATASGGTAPYTYSWSNGGNTSSVSNLSENTYYVTVKDQDNTSNVTTVHLRAKAPDNLTVTNLSSTNATLNWDVINGASFYYVQWRLLNATSWVNSASPTVNYQTISSLISDTIYEWAVRAVCPHLFSNMPFDTFATPSQCAEPTGLTEVIIAPTVVNIRWDSVTPQQEYLVRYREVGGSWKYVDIVPYSSGAHYSGGEITKQLGCCGGAMLDRLKPCTDYEWQVRSYCDSSHSSVSAFVPSTPRPFTTTNPSANAGSDMTICPNETVILVASCGGTDYSWSSGGTNDTIVVSPSEQTTYILTASSTGCTEIDIDSVTVFMSELSANFVSDTACHLDTTHFTDLSLTDSNSTIVSWQWHFGDVYSGTSIEQNPTYIYRVDSPLTCLKVTNNLGCVDSICKYVRTSLLRGKIEIEPTGSFYPINEELYFFDLSYDSFGWDIISWYWNFNDGTNSTSTAQNPTYEYDNCYPSPREVSLTVTNELGCVGYLYYNLYLCGTKSYKQKTIKKELLRLEWDNESLILNGNTENIYNVNIEVYNLLGEMLYKEQASVLLQGKKIIQFTNFRKTSNIYIVRAQVNNEIYTKKIYINK